jgi:hypothetical protein
MLGDVPASAVSLSYAETRSYTHSRSHVPSIAPGKFFVAQSWADFITKMADLIYDRHRHRRLRAVAA